MAITESQNKYRQKYADKTMLISTTITPSMIKQWKLLSTVFGMGLTMGNVERWHDWLGTKLSIESQGFNSDLAHLDPNCYRQCFPL